MHIQHSESTSGHKRNSGVPLPPFICSNIPAWSIYPIFQNLWFLSGFLDRGFLLTRKLQNQRFLLVKLMSSLRKFYGCHHDLIG